MPRFSFDLNGSDPLGNGSRAAPWQTIAKFNAERALGTFSQPDTIVEFRGGQVFSDAQLNLIGLTYTAAQRLLITSWGSGAAIIRSNVIGRHGVIVTNSTNVRFKKIAVEHLQGAALDATSTCVLLTSSTGVAFEDVELTGGVASIGSVASQFTAQRVVCRYGWGSGIVSDGGTQVLSDVEFYGIGYDSAFAVQPDANLGMALWAVGGAFSGDDVRFVKCRRALRCDAAATTQSFRRVWASVDRADQLDQFYTVAAATLILRDSVLRATGPQAPAPRWLFNWFGTLRWSGCTLHSDDLYTGLFTVPTGAYFIYGDNVAFVCQGTAQVIGWVGASITHQYRNCAYYAVSSIVQPFLVNAVQKTIAQWLALVPHTNSVQANPGYVNAARSGPQFAEVGATSPLVGTGLDLTGLYAGPLTDYFGFTREAPAPWSIGGYEFPVPTYQSFAEGSGRATLDGLPDVDCFASLSTVPPFPGFPAIDHYVEATVTFAHGMKSIGVWALGGRAGSGTTPPAQAVSETVYDYAFDGGAGRALEDSGAWEIGNTPGNDDPRRVRFELVGTGANGTQYEARISVTSPVLTLVSTTSGLSALVPVAAGGSYVLRLQIEYLGRTPNAAGGQDYLVTLRGLIGGTEVITLTALVLPQSYVEGVGIEFATGPAVWGGISGSRSRFGTAAPANALVAWTALTGRITGDLSALPSPSTTVGEARPKLYQARRDAVMNRLANGGFISFPRAIEVVRLSGVVPTLSGAAIAATPGAVPNLLTWLDASTLALPDFAPVDAWTPVAGAVTPVATTNARPTYRLNRLNGRAAVVFDGVDDSFLCPGLATARTAMTFFAVYKVTGAPGSENPLFHSLKPGQTTTRQAHYLTCGGLSPEDFYGGDPHLGGQVWASENTTALTGLFQPALYGTWTLHAHRGGAALVDVWRDGAAVASSIHGAPNIVDEDFKIGRGHSDTANYRHFKGELAELIVYGRALNDDEIDAVNDYLREKYALAYTPTTPPPAPTIEYRDTFVSAVADDATYSFDTRDTAAALGKWRVSGVGGTVEISPSAPDGTPYPSYDGGNLLRVGFTERGAIELTQTIDDVKPLRGRVVTAAYSGRRFAGRVKVELLVRFDGEERLLDVAYSTQFGEYVRRVATTTAPLNVGRVEFALRLTGEIGDTIGLSGAAFALGDYRFDLPYRESAAETAIPAGSVVMTVGASCPPGYRAVPESEGRLAFAATGDPNLLLRDFDYDDSSAVPEYPYEVDVVFLIDASSTQSGAAQKLTTLTWLNDLFQNRISRSGLVRAALVFTNRDYPGHVVLPLTPVTALTVANEFAAALTAIGADGVAPDFAGPGGDRMTQGLQAAKTLLETGTGRVRMLFYNTDASFQHATLATSFAALVGLPRFFEATAAVVNATLAAALTAGADTTVFPAPYDAAPGLLFAAEGGTPGPDPAGAHQSATEQGLYVARVFGDRIQEQVAFGLAARSRTPVSGRASRLGGRQFHQHAGDDVDGLAEAGDDLATTAVPLPARDTAAIKPYPFGFNPGSSRPEDAPALAVGVTHQHRYRTEMEAAPPAFQVRFCEKL